MRRGGPTRSFRSTMTNTLRAEHPVSGRALRTAAIGAIALVLALLAGVTGSAAAATPTWLTGQIIEPTAQTPINGLSCPSYTTCLAAASNIPVVQDNGKPYEPADPDPGQTLNAVSCAPGTDFCMFVDDGGGAFSYTDGTFGSAADIDGNIGIQSVSCPSSGFCMAVDDNNKVFKYSSGAWNGGTQLSTGTHSFNMTRVKVACASNSFCVAVANTSDGDLYYTWNGVTWSSARGPFDAAGGYPVSLSCTSTSFCLETDEAGYASVFKGAGWSAAQRVDHPMGIANPILHSACVGTSCVAVDTYDNFIQTSNGTTWTAAVNIGADTGMTGKGINSIACATPTLCVVGDGVGDASTYAIPPNPTKPTLTGSATVGQTLTLTNGTVQNPSVWYYDDWFRCDNPGVTCTIDPISTSTRSYTLAAADAGTYIDARESFGFGFDVEGFLAGDQLVSNIVGPITTPGGGDGGGGGGTGGGDGTGGGGGGGTGGGDGGGTGGGGGGTGGGGTKSGTATLTRSVSTTRAGVVTISLHCTGGACKGTAKLSKGGSAGYSIAAGQTTKIKLKLTAAAKKQLKKKHRLTVKLVIAPAGRTAATVTIKLKLGR